MRTARIRHKILEVERETLQLMGVRWRSEVRRGADLKCDEVRVNRGPARSRQEGARPKRVEQRKRKGRTLTDEQSRNKKR